MEADADLEDAVVQAADRGARVTPEELQRFVLLEELAGVELLDAVNELGRCRMVASSAHRLVNRAIRDALGRPRRLPVAATRPGRAQRR